MTSHLPAYLSRRLFFIFLLSLITAVPPLVVNIFLSQSKATLEDFLGKHLDQKVSIKRINYLPFNLIALKDVAIVSDSAIGEGLSSYIEKINVVFSLKELILNRNFQIDTIVFSKPATILSEYTFIEFSFEQLLEMVDYLAKDKDIRISFRDASITFKKNVNKFIVEFNGIFNIGSDRIISSNGSIKKSNLFLGGTLLETIKPGARPLIYRFKGKMGKKGLAIESLELSKNDKYLKLWGQFQDNTLRANGMVFVDNTYGMGLEEGRFATIKKIKDKLSSMRRSSPEVIGLSTSNLNIFDLDCLIKLSYSDIQIDKISFSLNNIPFVLKGNIPYLQPSNINLIFSSFPEQQPNERLNNPKRIDIKINGLLDKTKFNGRMVVDFLKETKTKQTPHRAEANFKNLSLDFPQGERLRLRSEEIDFYYKVSDNLYKIFLTDFYALLNLDEKRIKSVKFTSGVYDGFLKGSGIIDVSRMPFKSSFDLETKSVSANRLNTLLVYLSKVYGTFRGKIYYRSHPASHLYGNFLINDGYINNLIFFSWLAKFFNIPSLKKVYFDSLSAEFLVDDEVSRLKDIDLDAKDVRLDGYFDLYENDLVSSKLSLVFSEKLLKTSRKFEYLLRLLGDDIRLVNFNFQLSGLFDTMNFKWLESDFKARLKDLLPQGIEKVLERKIEKAIESLSTEEDS